MLTGSWPVLYPALWPTCRLHRLENQLPITHQSPRETQVFSLSLSASFCLALSHMHTHRRTHTQTHQPCARTQAPQPFTHTNQTQWFHLIRVCCISQLWCTNNQHCVSLWVGVCMCLCLCVCACAYTCVCVTQLGEWWGCLQHKDMEMYAAINLSSWKGEEEGERTRSKTEREVRTRQWRRGIPVTFTNF